MLVTIAKAAKILGVSSKHVVRLVNEAEISKKSRWRFGREIIDLTPTGAQRRTIRINLAAIMHVQQFPPHDAAECERDMSLYVAGRNGP